MDELHTQLEETSRTPVLLVASDFDGTLAPLANDPDAAEGHREGIIALRTLSAMAQTHVAIISGRSLEDLSKRVKEAADAHLVGSHGSEFEAGFAGALTPGREELLEKVKSTAEEIAGHTDGALVENKPAAVAFHYRNVQEDGREMAVKQLLDRAGDWPGVQVRHGKMVVELSVLETDKGSALGSLRQRLGATAVVYLGDDVTDEDAFATLTGPDVGVKVGEGRSVAKYRVADTMEAARLLAWIAEKRGAWVAGSEAVPIEKHALLSDQRTCALITPGGRVTWMCVPRIDSPGIFADLLGGPAAGYFDVHPAGEAGEARQAYVGDTFVLSTQWARMRVTDYLDCSGGRPHQRAGRTDLLRVLERTGEAGGVKAEVTFAPRLDFGGVETRMRVVTDGVEVEGAVDPCVLYAPGIQWSIRCEGKHEVAHADVEVGSEPVVLELRFGTASVAAAKASEGKRRQQTARFWEMWAAALVLPQKYREQVMRSALALRALVYGPTGAIAAAATTSLPEHAGGVRNWDYRFCWPRDASMAAGALLKLEASGPAMRLLDWLLGIVQDRETALIRPVYSVTGAQLGAEGEVGELSGYRGSRPVRVGNSAAHQLQLDVLGPVAELLEMLARSGASLTQEHWRMTEAMVAAVAERWTETDHGIWEMRGSRRHHVHSKVMCWKTVDGALHVAEHLGRRPKDWKALRQLIAEDILANGWKEREQAFCATYEGTHIDAATLSVGLSGLLPADDKRFILTVEAVERSLLEGPTVYRYRNDDGLPGVEGGFNLCTAWLIESYALIGRTGDAEKLFEKYLKLLGPTGLMAEEYDPWTGQSLGNYPQAYSHIGLINCALRLTGAGRGGV